MTLDGDDVIDCGTIGGVFMLRSRKKRVENRIIVQYSPYVTPLDYLSTMFTEAAAVNAQEQSGNTQVPPRASNIRVIMQELGRLSSNL